MKFTQPMIDFIKKNYDKTTTDRELSELFNKKFNTNVSYKSINAKVVQLKLNDKTRIVKGFTRVQNKYLTDCSTFKLETLTRRFNKLFNTNKTTDNIYKQLVKLGLLKQHKCNKLIHIDKQKEWLKTHKDIYTYRQLAIKFNSHFKMNVSVSTIYRACKE